MLIYLVPNLAQNTCAYVCDSQATIDAAPELKKPLCVIGTQSDADTMLFANQQAWLTQKESLFTCNLQTTVEGGVVWTVVNLDNEPANTDREYFVFDPTTGLYTEAIGLTAAQALLTQMHQTYLTFTNMASYTIMTSWK